MMRVYHPQRMMSILTICIILIITTSCQASQSQALSISQYKENYLQCNTKSDYENNKNWILQMKVLAESQNNMTSVRGRFVKVHKTGSVIVLCYVKTIDAENIWITKLYHISKDKGFNLVMKEILPANNPDVYSAAPPLVKTKLVQRDQRYTISCSHIYSVNERRNLQLLRILNNGTKLFIKMNALKLSASIKRGNLIMIEYDHEFIYDPYDYLNNLFECRSVGNYFNDIKSSIIKNGPPNSICHKYGDRTYYFVKSAKKYTDAKNFCLNYGMRMVHVKDDEHNDWLYKTSGAMKSKYWVGLDDKAKEGHFVWQDGQPVSYRKWAKGEPNNAGNEDCVEYSHTDKNNGLWNDVECDRVRKFICESGKKNCGITKNECSIPFEYKGKTYDSCTKDGESFYWCSTDRVYAGNYIWCNMDFPNYVTQNELIALSEMKLSVDWSCLSKCGLKSAGCITQSGCLRHRPSKWNIAKCLVRECALSSIFCVMECLV